MELARFLVKAKGSTYADGGGTGAALLADGSKELAFEEGGLKYRDRYFGSDPFAGEEVVWRGEEMIWVMNYYGAVNDDTVPAGRVFAFLQRALRQVREDRPFRGPRHYAEEEFEYLDDSRGTLERFLGIERILHQGREVYRLDYHGGTVKDK